MPRLRTVFMGSPDFAVASLRALTSTEQVGILGVFTQPDRPRGRGLQVQASPVKEFALACGFPVWQPERLAGEESVAMLAGLKPDLIVVVAYGQKIPGAVLAMPPYGCINVHGSLLPKYRGAAPIHRAIMDGCDETGLTTMYMDAGWDTGDMILTAKLPIWPDETVGSLHDRLAVLGGSLLIETVDRIVAGNAPRIPQDHEAATFAPKLRPEDSHVDWTCTAEAIHNQIRGMNPWPVACTFRQGQPLRLWGSRRFGEEPLTDPGNFPPGTIVEIRKDAGFIVQTGRGLLAVTEVQPPGRNRMPAHAYPSGYGLQPGDRFDCLISG